MEAWCAATRNTCGFMEGQIHTLLLENFGKWILCCFNGIWLPTLLDTGKEGEKNRIEKKKERKEKRNQKKRKNPKKKFYMAHLSLSLFLLCFFFLPFSHK